MVQEAKAFHCVKLDGKVLVTKYKFDKKRKEEGKHAIVAREVEEDAGYFVQFPRKHSLRLSKQEAINYGFVRPDGSIVDAPVVDMETGDVKPKGMMDVAMQAAVGTPLVNLVKETSK